MEVFNLNNMKNKQRIGIAIIAGLITAILCAIVFAAINNAIKMNLSILYVAIAYAIGYSIQYFGRGVTIKFSVIGIVCFIISIFLTNTFSLWFSFSMMNFDLFIYSIQMTLIELETFTANAIVRDLFIAFGIYVAYYVSRVL